MSNPLYLLFDIDGTLIDAAGAGRLSLDLALEQEFEKSRTEPIALQGRTDLGIFTEYLERHQIEVTPQNLQRFRLAYLTLLPQQMHLRPGKVCSGVESLLSVLGGDHRFKMGLLTGNSEQSAKIKLTHFNLHSWFTFGIYGENALKRIDLAQDISDVLHRVTPEPWDKHQVVVIGDTPDDVALGKAFGAKTIAVGTGGHSWEELQSSDPTLLLEDLQEGYEVLEGFLKKVNSR
jgi:phosphoglycolate phosphatase